MIDIHCHVLPGLDDGPRDLETSLQLLTQLIRQGVGTVICTPHFSPRKMTRTEEVINFLDRRDDTLRELAVASSRNGLQISLLPGLEIDISADLPELLADARIASRCGLAGSASLLLEFTRFYPESLPMIDTLLYELQTGGFTPILAHPERTLQNVPENLIATLCSWVEQERVKLQINASSIADLNRTLDLPFMQGYKRRKITRHLLNDELVSYVASDAHHPELRPPQMAAAAAWLSKKKEHAIAERLLYSQAKTLLPELDKSE